MGIWNGKLRTPDLVVGEPSNPYLLRWHITPWSGWFRRDKYGNEIESSELPWFKRFWRYLPNAHIHKFLRDDDDRALHDHPWPSLSVILSNGYWEVTPEGKYWREEFFIYGRAASARHRVVLERYWFNGEERLTPAWTLFLTGFKVREWGFHCPKGFVHWKDFVAKTNRGQVGRGCGEP